MKDENRKQGQNEGWKKEMGGTRSRRRKIIGKGWIAERRKNKGK